MNNPTPNIRLQLLRRSKGLKQVDLAQLAKLTPGTVVTAEHGRQISLSSKKKIAIALGCGLSDLFSA